MSYLIQYLSYVHTVFGFQLLLTHSVLNSTKIKTTPNLNFKTNMTSSIMTSYSDKFYKKVFLNDWHVESRRSASCCRTACLNKYSNSVVWVSAFWVFTLDSGAWVSAFIVFCFLGFWIFLINIQSFGLVEYLISCFGGISVYSPWLTITRGAWKNLTFSTLDRFSPVLFPQLRARQRTMMKTI